MADFAFTFGKEVPPFEEAVAWFLAKRIVSKAEFEAMSAAMKAKAFTAAYVYAADDLQRVFEACEAAISRGSTYREFTRATEEILRRSWHRETVFRTNVLSSYGAGHWEQAQQIRALRPYARYSAVMDGRTRPLHAALHGLIYPLDHPFWQRYWPPWDYNCRCAAVTLSVWEIQNQGLQVSTRWDGSLPPMPKNFQSPAQGGVWRPDYGKYAPELAATLRQGVERAIYE